ncbi:MAG: hypothetical protein RL398_1801, partial [Planctomycetota bacterium]
CKVTGTHTPVPSSPQLEELTMPSVDAIVATARRLSEEY